MSASEYRFTLDGDEFRVVVVGDVVSIPGYAGAPGWSMGGFGASVSEEWLMHEGRLPGSKARQRALASMIRTSLALAHAGTPPPGDWPRAFVRCPACAASPVAGHVPHVGVTPEPA